MNNELIDQIAKARGIETRYVNAWGQDAEVDPSSKGKLLKAMGYSIDNNDELQEQLEIEKQDYWLSALNPVKIVRINEAIELEVRVPILHANEKLKCVIQTEQGQKVEAVFVPVDGTLLDVEVINELEYHEYLVSLPVDLVIGYHQIQLLDEQEACLATQKIIVAPNTCFQPKAIEQGQKVWGTSVQLYCLKSKTNWGIGDFSDLNVLVNEIASRGGHFVGLNPIHALYPANPDSCSPYSPSSRRWLNIFYIDPQVVDGFNQSETIQKLIQSGHHLSLLNDARQSEFVNYSAVAKLKMPVFKALYQWFKDNHLAKNSKRAQLFSQFVETGGESLLQQSVFDAIQDVLHAKGITAWGWPSWPEDLNEFDKPKVEEFAKDHEDLINCYHYLQWIAAEQLEQCQATAQSHNMLIGLYRDLAVGVSAGSAEVWANRDLYCADISVGAPPDPLGPQGQSWGLPPMEPNQLFEQQYQPIIDLYRANMQSCGALRIDHVMALLRLWWVPGGEHATKGAYVYYPIDDLLALLCLESQRNQCMVIGEDLGTVPEGIRDIFAENCVLSYRVFFFETAADGGFYSPSHYPKQAVATLTTHDMPTLKGFWHCDDLELGKTLGVYPDDAELEGLRHARHMSKQRILDSLHGHNALPDGISGEAFEVGMDQALNFSMQLHMARSNSALLSLQLEDWLEMDKPVNVPGTCDEYPNWRRKLSVDLDDIFSKPEINQLAKDLNMARQQA